MSEATCSPSSGSAPSDARNIGPGLDPLTVTTSRHEDETMHQRLTVEEMRAYLPRLTATRRDWPESVDEPFSDDPA